MKQSKRPYTRNSMEHLPKPKPTEVPRFEVDDPQGYQFLENNGYAVFANVASSEQVIQADVLAWNYLEGLDEGIDRNDTTTWGVPGWPNSFGNGIIAGDGVGQCELLWMTRAIPKVKQIFSTIWNTPDLVTSFDGMCINRPDEYNDSWKPPYNLWYHLDQNGHHKPGKVCIQGQMTYTPAGLHDGGFVVVPGSHKIFSDIFKKRPHLKSRNEFIRLTSDVPLWKYEIPQAGLSPIKVCSSPGDFVVWDSRSIHCSIPSDQKREIPKDGSLLPLRRIVAYVCMTPMERLNRDSIKERVNCYSNGLTTSHWPEDVFVPNIRQNRKKYVPLKLTDEQKQLIPM